MIGRRIFRLLYIAPLWMLSSACSTSETVEPQVNTSNPRKSFQDEMVHGVMKDYFNSSAHVGAVVGVYRENAVSWYGYGEVAKGSQKLPDEKTIFEIGSITKTFTAALTVSWLEGKKVGLDSPVAPFLPVNVRAGLTKDNKEVTFRQLLDYSSGLPEDNEISNLTTTPGYKPANPYMHYDSTLIYEYIAKNALRFVPGTTFKYSNMGYGLAGLILTRNTKKAFGDIVTEQICKPLQLEDTGAKLNSTQQLRMAQGYDPNGKQVAHWTSIGGFESSGILVSSASDLMKYGRAQLLKDQDDLTRIFGITQKESFSFTSSAGNQKNGLAWTLFDASVGGGGVVKTGGTGGFSSLLAVAPSKGMVVVVLFNNYSQVADLAAANLASMLLRY